MFIWNILCLSWPIFEKTNNLHVCPAPTPTQTPLSKPVIQLQCFWDPALHTAAAQHPCWSWSLKLDFNLEFKSSSKDNDLEWAGKGLSDTSLF